MNDDDLARLLTFPNVIVTGHQAFFTDEALMNICDTTLHNIIDIKTTGKCTNAVQSPKSSWRNYILHLIIVMNCLFYFAIIFWFFFIKILKRWLFCKLLI